MYESKIEEIMMFCNKYFEKLVNEHKAKLKQLDDDYDDTAGDVWECVLIERDFEKETVTQFSSNNSNRA